MSAKDKPVKRRLEIIYTPIVTVHVEEFEDGTFDVKSHTDIDFSDSFSYVYNTDTGDEYTTSELADFFVPMMTTADELLGTLKLLEYYQPAWTPEDEPF